MVHHSNKAKAHFLSLLRRAKAFVTKNKLLFKRIGCGLLLHLLAAALETLLIRLGLPALYAFVVAIAIALALEAVCISHESETRR